MGNEYQNRRDIDRLYNTIFNQIDGSYNLVGYGDDNLKNITATGESTGTLHEIFLYYHLYTINELEATIVELERRVEELEKNVIE